jgi:hypothetical protein
VINDAPTAEDRALGDQVDQALRDNFHLTPTEPPPHARLRYAERILIFSDRAALANEIVHEIARRAKPGDDTVYWRWRPETDPARGKCYFRFCVGRAA